METAFYSGAALLAWAKVATVILGGVVLFGIVLGARNIAEALVN